MKHIAAVLITILALAITAGCQAPPASKGYNVNLSAPVPPSDGDAAPYSYAVFREIITGASCDLTSSTSWKEITVPTARPTTPAYTDGTATGLKACYFLVTYQTPTGQTVPQNSGPSNVVSLQVPGVPLAPVLNAPSATQQAALGDAPLQAAPTATMAKLEPLRLTVRASKR